MMQGRSHRSSRSRRATRHVAVTALLCAIVTGCSERSTTEPGTAGSPTLSGGFASASQDAFTLKEASIVGDFLVLGVEYGGGCEEHRFALHLSGMFQESNPVQTGGLISHDAKGDPCRALIRETLTFDLAPLKQSWQHAYQQRAGVINLGIAYPSREGRKNVRLLYSFER